MKRGALHKSLVWLRSDLRTEDNPALAQASSFSGTSDGVTALFVVSPCDWQRHDWGPVRVDFVRRNLKDLACQLWAKYSIPLHVVLVDKFSQVPERLVAFCREHSIDAVWFNKEFEWDELQRDEEAIRALDRARILCRSFQDQCVIEPGEVLTKEGRPYTVFTPYKRSWLAYLEARPLVLEGKVVRQQAASVEGLSIEQILQAIEDVFDALPRELRELDRSKGLCLKELWPEGEAVALERLHQFVSTHGKAYKKHRDLPALTHGTSRLSPYLALGVLSVRMCALEAWKRNSMKWSSGDEGLLTWISEICWRDFYRHILVSFPRVGRNEPFQQATDKVAWRYPKDDPLAAADFERWCGGSTGFPIVDAAMRQMQATGWMHNRLRMIVASFLTKDLLVRSKQWWPDSIFRLIGDVVKGISCGV